MNSENNWRHKSLESLEQNIGSDLSSEGNSYVIRTCNSLRKKLLKDFTTEDLRIMIGQEIGLSFLIPMALETLRDNLFAEGDMFEGDLLKNVLAIDTKFWDQNKKYWLLLNDLIKERRQEITEMKFDITNFDNSKHKK